MKFTLLRYKRNIEDVWYNLHRKWCWLIHSWSWEPRRIAYRDYTYCPKCEEFIWEY